MTAGEIKTVSPRKLYGRKQADCLAKQFFFFFGEYTGGTPLLDCMKQQSISQILLKIIALIFGNNINLGNRQTGLAEMSSHIKECIILLDRRSGYTDQGFHACQPEITAVGAGRW